MQTVREGGVVVRAPEQPASGAGDEVFYNPEQELNRDLTIATLRAFRDRERADTYLDATTATGIRGVRAAADGWDVTCLDVDPEAVELARANFRANDVVGAVRHRDANVDLHRNRYDVVDVDPFGSPIPFADAAVRGTRKLLCVTATDTAPLCGAHFNAGVRRYGAVPRNTEYHAEVGVRVLLSALARTAARYDVGVRPLLTHATRHYVRTYLELDGGGGVADDAVAELGYVHHCPECLHREAESWLIAHPPEGCPACGGDQVLTAGPLWLGAIRERAFVSAVDDALDEGMGTADAARKLLSTLEAELDVPTHYDQHRLCKRWGRAAGPMDGFIEALREAGFTASRTHYGGTTFKTTADVTEVREVTGE